MPHDDTLWRPPPADLVLTPGEIHVWLASLEPTMAQRQQLWSTLSEAEQGRAERFHFERDQLRFAVGRGVLRNLLGRYLGQRPGQLAFRYGPYGKPALADAAVEGGLRFNLSHSHELALYAFVGEQEIGVDIEHIRPLADWESLARQVFSARENQTLHGLPPEQRLEAFYNCWTRKEAYVKAGGAGLAQPLDQFDVSLTPGQAAQLLHIEGRADDVARWFLHGLKPAPDYVAALAIQGLPRRISLWQWSIEAIVT